VTRTDRGSSLHFRSLIEGSDQQDEDIEVDSRVTQVPLGVSSDLCILYIVEKTNQPSKGLGKTCKDAEAENEPGGAS